MESPAVAGLSPLPLLIELPPALASEVWVGGARWKGRGFEAAVPVPPHRVKRLE